MLFIAQRESVLKDTLRRLVENHVEGVVRSQVRGNVAVGDARMRVRERCLVDRVARVVHASVGVAAAMVMTVTMTVVLAGRGALGVPPPRGLELAVDVDDEAVVVLDSLVDGEHQLDTVVADAAIRRHRDILVLVHLEQRS